MNRLLLILCAVYVAGDPTLSMLDAFSDTKDLIVATLFAYAMVPWVVSQIEN